MNGTDKDSTRTGDVRRIVLGLRAIGVLRRHLALRNELVRSGRIDLDHLCFTSNGQPIRNLQYPGMRWHRTLSRCANIRYRRPYTARHTSVSWDLMIGRGAPWVARQHGHSISTMLRFYAAWADGAPESDVERIRATPNSERPLESSFPTRRTKPTRAIARPFEMESKADRNQPAARFATKSVTEQGASRADSLSARGKTGRSSRSSRRETFTGHRTDQHGSPQDLRD